MARTKKAKRAQRPYVADSGRSFTGAGDRILSWSAMVVLALAVGFAIGFVVFLLMSLSGWLTTLLWEGVGARLGIPAFSLICCTLGGIVIGVWTHLTHNTIDDLEVVMGEFQKTGSYRLENAPATAVSFLLPLAFGGPVGFEAGLTGIICAGCCWIRDKLKLAGLRAAGIADVTIAASLSAIFGAPLAGLVAGLESEGKGTLSAEVGSVDDYDMRRQAKLVLYLAAAIGALGGVVALSALTGGSGGMPRFDHIEARGTELLWALPCLAAAYVLLLVFHATKLAATKLSSTLETLEAASVVRPVIAGVVLGAIALVFPLVLFPGEEQCSELLEGWSTYAAPMLIAVGVLKAALTPFCIHMGWKGGDLFPCIFAGVSLGFGLAALTGADPMLMVTVTATCFLAGVTGKPVLTLAILALCFPLDGILWMGVAAIVGSVLPVPASHAPARG